METECTRVLPPLARNFSDTVAAGARSHWARNCSGVAAFSADQIAERWGDVPSNAAPKALIAAWLARQITLAPSTSNAGQFALSKPKPASTFMHPIWHTFSRNTSAVARRIFSHALRRQAPQHVKAALGSFPPPGW